MATITGDITVNADSTLQNLIVNGTIYINPGQNGIVTLDNVDATNTIIQSGGTNSIHLKNSTIGNLFVRDRDNGVRVEITGTTAITNTKVESGAKLDVAIGMNASFGAIELAPVTVGQNIELVRVTEVVTITNPVAVISVTPVTTKIESGVEVTIKKDTNDQGIKVEGTGGEAATIDPTEVNRVMGLLEDNMFDKDIYPGRGDNNYTLASMVTEKVKALTQDKNIELTVTNEDVDYGYYKVTLKIAGATASKLIKVDTVTVNSAAGFKDALSFDINIIILLFSCNIIINEDVNISKLKNIELNNSTLTINGDTITRFIKEADSSLIEGNGLIESNGVYSTSFTWGSNNGIGTKNVKPAGSPGGYDYYTDGAFLRFTVKRGNDIVKFNEVFKTFADGNNTAGGMTLQTNIGNINDMDGSDRELADWGDSSKSSYATNLPGVNSLFYGVIQNTTDRTKTVGFNAGEYRTINMTLEPLMDLEVGAYTVEVEVVQQTTNKVFDKIVYKFEVEAVEQDRIKPVIENAALDIDGAALLVKFSINETIDLANGADVQLKYYTQVDNQLTAITNSKEGGSPLVKNKTWAGYLANVNEPAGNYSSGTENENYTNEIVANTLIGSKTQKGYQSPGIDMDYVEITDFSVAPGEYVVEITVTDNAGNVSETVTVTVTVK